MAESGDNVVSLAIDRSTYFSKYKSLIAYANEFRRKAGRADAMAGLAIDRIRAQRESSSGSASEPASKTAYIIRQFKRPEEVNLMRRTYGRKFIQTSIFGSDIERQRIIAKKIREYDTSPKKDSQCQSEALQLIEQDFNETNEVSGQRLSDVFHLGDVFVDGIDRVQSRETVERFVQAFFGSNFSSPNKDEYGLYIASAAALRSVDVSRQVGAAIFTKSGEVIALGCNEVPKANGGTYWSDDDRIFRDMEMGKDPNQERRNVILHDLLDRMGKSGLLSDALVESGNTQSQVINMLDITSIRDAQIMDILEYSRVIHAEMSAISDSARLGRRTLGATLFCTTFPCHMCAKHIVAAGVDRVVFLEPFPKSYAKELHEDTITFNKAETGKVVFEPFIGISPRRYRDIFEKRRRKDQKGKVKDWYEDGPVPMIEDKGTSYIKYEEGHLFKSLKRLHAGKPETEQEEKPAPD